MIPVHIFGLSFDTMRKKVQVYPSAFTTHVTETAPFDPQCTAALSDGPKVRCRIKRQLLKVSEHCTPLLSLKFL